MKRIDGRKPNELRVLKVKRQYQKNALGSCMFEAGDTRVVCAVTMEEKVPPFLRGTGKGWLSAEYGMLPASCTERIQRESSKGKVGGRTQEIQRLIGRTLRAALDLTVLGERMIWVDCDVIQGDGGTRTAGISGSFIALSDAIHQLIHKGMITKNPIKDHVAAVSVGIINGVPTLDLCYAEDSNAEVDMNVVMTGSGKMIEVQGTAEKEAFSETDLNHMLALAKKGIADIVKFQKKNTHTF